MVCAWTENLYDLPSNDLTFTEGRPGRDSTTVGSQSWQLHKQKRQKLVTTTEIETFGTVLHPLSDRLVDLGQWR